jgi:hypothetical protein
MQSNSEIPEGVPEDPSIGLQEFFRGIVQNELGMHMSSVRLRMRDGIPYFALSSIGAAALGPSLDPIDAMTVCAMIWKELLDAGLPPGGREEVGVGVEDEDGKAIGYAILRAWDGETTTPLDEKEFRVRVLDLFSPLHVKIGSFPPEWEELEEEDEIK